MYNIYIETYGCSANQNNSEIMAGMLSSAGLNVVRNKDLADVIILNTCIVKGPTEQRMCSRIKELAGKKQKLIIAGCMPSAEADKIKKISPKAVLVGIHDIRKILLAVSSAIKGKQKDFLSKQDEEKLCLPKIPFNKTIGINQISEGCSGNCSYCFTKFAKGNLFSYSQQNILKSVRNDLAAGCKEVWLTSQDNAAYGIDYGSRMLSELLENIFALKGKFLVRLGMMNPNNVLPILDDLIKSYRNEKMFKFLHIPLQSGSDSVLKAMNRNYSVKDFLKIINSFRKAIPDITISTDVICGYPTETEGDFQQTLEIIKKIKPDILNISKFWSMPRTQASKLQQLSSEEIKKRSTKLALLHKKIALDNNKKWLGQKIRCLIDDFGKNNDMLARNECYKQIVLKADKFSLGKFVNIKITEITPHYLIGEII